MFHRATDHHLTKVYIDNQTVIDYHSLVFWHAMHHPGPTTVKHTSYNIIIHIHQYKFCIYQEVWFQSNLCCLRVNCENTIISKVLSFRYFFLENPLWYYKKHTNNNKWYAYHFTAWAVTQPCLETVMETCMYVCLIVNCYSLVV